MPAPCLTTDELHAAAEAPAPAHEEHLSTCGACRAAVESIRADNQLAAELASVNDRPPMPSVGGRSGTVLLPGMGGDFTTEYPAGTRIGRYTIVSVLGVGGMGVVYRAEQEAPRRPVALKLIRPELASPSVIRRFEHEAEALALLKHPGIAQVYEAGVGAVESDPALQVPYFAMELVEGRRLDQFVKQESPSRREILMLVAALCDAVDHAHRRGVIHRDLKPANILVESDEATERRSDEGSGTAEQAAASPSVASSAGERRSVAVPRILDFGVAKLTAASAGAGGGGVLAATIDATQPGGFVGTLTYASPEQVAGDPSAIDARADVFALGLILYELIVGKRAYTLDGPLNTSVRMVAEARIATPESLGVRLDSELTTILNTALAPDPARRYQSAALLAEDIRRYLDKRPLLARADSTAYILRKAVARHPYRAAAAALVVLMFIAAGVSAMLAARAERLKGRLAASMVRSLERADQDDDDSTERVASMDELFDAFAASIGENLGDYPAERAELMLQLARASLSHMRMETSIRMLEQPAAYWGERAASNPAELAAVLHEFGRAKFLQGQYDAAYADFARAVELRESELGRDHPDTLDSRYWVGAALHGWKRYPEAEKRFREVIDSLRASGVESPLLAKALTGVAAAARQDNKTEALARAEEALAIIQRIHGPSAKHATVALGNIIANLIDLERYDEADTAIGEAMRIVEVNYGPDDPRVANRLVQRAKLGLKRAEKVEGGNPTEMLEKAAKDAERTLELRRRVYKDADHELVAEALSMFGQIRVAQGQLDEARTLLSDALEMRRRLPRKNDGALGRSESMLGDCLRRLNDHAAAEPLLRSGLEKVRAAYGPESLPATEAAERLAALKPEEAADERR